MDILIKGMEKPISCDDCIVPLSKCDFLQRRTDECPIIEIPTPHGRLIDGDELINDLRIYESKYCGEQGYITQDDIIDAPTILEAEE